MSEVDESLACSTSCILSIMLRKAIQINLGPFVMELEKIQPILRATEK